MNQKSLFEIKKFSAPPVFFTDRKKISNFEKIINSLPNGSMIIIREYDLDKKSREDFARQIVKICNEKPLKIIVGKDIELAKKIKADGIHFSDLDRIPLLFFKKKSFPKNFIFSFSCHSFKPGLRILKLGITDIFFAPIFPTTSHRGTKNLGPLALAKISLKTKKLHYLRARVYALGGINLKNIKLVRKLSISGFAAIDFFEENL